ncbi:ABC transporter substrate-binding protein [Kallipyga gabonensis]|uniref:ABC transporter substrate-binding protein n=1 Tax=Kallipyga gabonensis TaxID=1686287 RepID=UPI0006B4203A|nr:ABC transporter substrate-binding protein [Kallipyga gabonensis]
MKKTIVSLLLAFCLCLSLAACGNSTPSKETSGSESAQSQEETSTSESTEPASEESKAGLSGKVTIYMPSPAKLADKLAAAFTEKTGVEVELFQGTTGEILARLEAEKANPVADVVVLASWSDGLTMKADGQLESYSPVEKDKINEGWIDSDSTIFGYSASAVGVIYNTEIVPELNADWKDLADAKYKDMIAIPDPEKSGACKDFLAGLVTGTDDGEAVMQGWADNGLTVPGANKAALEAVTTGEKGILIAGVDYNAYSSINKGEPLNIYYPASGTVVNPRPAMILKTAPNMDNAKAFVDFLFSDEAQKVVADAYLLSGRKDITSDKRTNLADIPQIKTDWSKMMDVASDTAAKLNSITK